MSDGYVPAWTEADLTGLLVNGRVVSDTLRVETAEELGRERVMGVIEYHALPGAGLEVPDDGWQRIEDALVEAFRRGVREALAEQREAVRS